MYLYYDDEVLRRKLHTSREIENIAWLIILSGFFNHLLHSARY